MSIASTVIAYHGCDVTVRDDLVTGRLHRLTHSNNDYDWLGPGAYFFEGDAARALFFAHASHNHPEKKYTARPIASPSVVGSMLKVTNWLDMTTQAGLGEFKENDQAMLAGLETDQSAMPQNRPASGDDVDILYRALDNAVFNWVHRTRAQMSPPRVPYQAVRAAFHQGPEIAPRSGFHERTHIQIALRDDGCVFAWFLPENSTLLTEEQYAGAKARLDAAVVRYRKPRVRAKNR